MASSRRTGSNENIQTFGDGTRDFTNISTWESAVDIDTVTAMQSEVLECYDDSAPYDQTALYNAGTHNSTYPIIMRAATGHENNGSRTAGVRFHTTAASAEFADVRDDSVWFYDLGIQCAFNTSSTEENFKQANQDLRLVGIHIYNSSNSGTGSNDGIAMNNSTTNLRMINCIVVDSDRDGLRTGSSSTGHIIYNCTFADNAEDGLDHNNTTASTATVRNCLCDNNTGQDFGSTGGYTGSGNASSDTTAPGTSPRTSQTFTFVSATDYHLAAGDTGARTFGVDLSADATFDFDDDIDKDTRTVSWDIGADEDSTAAPAGQPVGAMMRLGVGQ